MIWIQAIRPKTLFAGICPVLLGTVLAMQYGVFDPILFLITLLSALSIQIGTNLANDYFDHKKGADTSMRKGPLRVTAAGLVAPETMRLATFLTFSCTAILSPYLVYHGGLPISILSALAIFLGVAYTGGPYPLAYLGLGDLFVLIFYGPVSTAVTTFLQTKTLSWEAVVLGLCLGLISTAILTVNNFRDIEEDRRSKKRTLCVRFGKRWGRFEYILCLTLALLLPFGVGYFAQLVLFIPATFLIRQFKQEKELNGLLAKTGLFLFIYTLILITEIAYAAAAAS